MSSTVVPAGDQVLDHRPQLGAALRVEPGGRLVEEEHRRLVHERRGEVEPPAHAAGVRADEAVARVREVEPLEQLVGARPDLVVGDVGEPADEPQVLRRGEVLVDRRVLTRRARSSARTRIGCSVTSYPSTRARPPSGCSSVVSTRTAVVLPAPFGPSSPSTRPDRHLERDALQRFELSEALDEVDDLDRVGRGRGLLHFDAGYDDANRNVIPDSWVPSNPPVRGSE